MLPALASLMSGEVVVPEGTGGETEFASARRAFETFPEREAVEELICHTAVTGALKGSFPEF